MLHLELEDGTEQDCAVIALFSVEELNDQEYIALVSVEDLESEDEESALLLYRYKDCSESFLFLMGTFLGGAYEYLCSVLSEIVFGKVFWDYSKMPFNLNGRINLLYCFFWGIATVAWFKKIYPLLSGLIEKLPIAFGTVFTWFVVVFMTLNMLMSLSALIRYDQRDKQVPASNGFERFLDTHYNDQKMKKIYPKAEKVHS